MDAYESFIKGRYFYYSFKKGGMEKALQHYKQAITLDPNYAPAYSAVAEWYWLISFTGQKLLKENIYTKAKEAINMALEIDNNLPEAHSTLGLIRWSHECDWKGAEKSFKTAINLNPGFSKPHRDYAYYLAAVKANPDKSILEARKAIELDPLSGPAYLVLGYSLLVSGQFDQAIEELRYGLEMTPDLIASYWLIGWAYARKGRFEEATREINKGLELFPKHPTLLRTMGVIYALKGEKEKTGAILNELLERSKKEYVSFVDIALLSANLEEFDQAFEYLEKSYEKRDIWLSQIRFLIPLSHILYTDPRFIAFLKKMGLEE